MITTIAGGGFGDGISYHYRNQPTLPVFRLIQLKNLHIFDNANAASEKYRAATGIINTIAGGGPAGSNAGGIPAINADLITVNSFTVRQVRKHLYYFPGLIRKIDATTGIITRVTGLNPIGYSGDGGLSINANVQFPGAITTDTLGNIYFADTYRIRKITVATGVITTIAGTGTSGYSGDGGPAISALLSSSTTITTDGAGNVYVTDNNNNVIRRITAATG